MRRLTKLLAPLCAVAIVSACADESPEYQTVRSAISATATITGPDSVDEGSSIILTASSDLAGATFSWDLDGDLLYDDAIGDSVTINGIDGPSSRDVKVRATDGTNEAFATKTVTTNNVAPTVSSVSTSGTLEAGSTINFSASVSDPAGSHDTLSYAWNFGDTTTSTLASPSHAYSTAGTYDASLVVSDEDGGSSAAYLFSLTIAAAFPSVTGISTTPTSPGEGESTTFSATLSDPAQADSVSYAWDFGDGNVSILKSPSHAYANDGTYIVSVTISDGDTKSDTASTSLVVTNVAPSVSNIVTDPAAPVEGGSVTLSATVSDPGADTLTYAWDFGDGATSTLASPTHTWKQDGAYIVTLTVSDGDGGSTVATSTVTVANAAPSVTAINVSPTALSETETAVLSVDFTDAGTMDTFTYAWNFGDGNTSIAASPSHSWADDGVYTVQVTVTDDGGASGSTSLNVTVANIAPTITAATATPNPAMEGDSISFTGSATDPAGDADPITYAWSFGDGGTAAVANPVHIYADNGIYPVTLTVSDGDGGSDTTTFDLTVHNVAPSIDAMTFLPTAPFEGDDIAFSATVSDPSTTDTFTYAWDFGDESSSTEPAPTHTYSDDGSYTVTLTVTDNDGGSVSSQMTVDVLNADPQIASFSHSPKAPSEGELMSFTAVVSDAGTNDDLSYVWDFGDGATSTEISPNYTFVDVGTYTVTLTVTDKDGGKATGTLDVAVANVEPVITLAEATPSPAVEGDNVAFSATVVSAPNDGLTYVWNFGDGNGSTKVSPTHVYADNDTYTVVVTVTDDDGSSDSANFDLTVTNARPTVMGIHPSPLNPAPGEAMTISASVSDPGSADTFTYAWDFGDGATSLEEMPTHTYAADGSYAVTVTVTDDDGAANTGTMTIIVNSVNDAPEAHDDLFRIDEDSVDVVLDILANDIDIDEDVLTIVTTTTPSNGTLSHDGSVATYSPNPDFNGLDSFTYTISDPFGETSTATVVIEVRPVNDAPEFVAPTPNAGESFQVLEGNALSFTLQATDIDSSLLSYDVVPTPSSATIDSRTGSFFWKPTWEEAGIYELTLEATDGEATASRMIEVSVTALDEDEDGLPDTWELSVGLDPTSKDSDGDTISDEYEVGDIYAPFDTDGDGIIDALDHDSDGDGLLDIDEAGDADLTTDPIDTDGDGVPDFRDLDSDGDGVEDAIDNCPTVANPDQRDTAGNGTGDACDTDTDGDGVPDAIEEFFGTDPLNPDTDGDSISDGDEFGPFDNPFDTDGDGVIDALDLDSDGDGILDRDEAGDDDLTTPPVDTDKDGIPDFRDLDSDDDGVGDDIDNCRIVANAEQTDTDGDGIGDSCSDDADGDGVLDDVDNCRLVSNPDQADLDGDGRGDACDGDVDGDGVANDEDNCPLLANSQQLDSDADGVGDACDDTPYPIVEEEEEDPTPDVRPKFDEEPDHGGCSTTGGSPLGTGLLLFAFAAFGHVVRRWRKLT